MQSSKNFAHLTCYRVPVTQTATRLSQESCTMLEYCLHIFHGLTCLSSYCPLALFEVGSNTLSKLHYTRIMDCSWVFYQPCVQCFITCSLELCQCSCHLLHIQTCGKMIQPTDWSTEVFNHQKIEYISELRISAFQKNREFTATSPIATKTTLYMYAGLQCFDVFACGPQ